MLVCVIAVMALVSLTQFRMRDEGPVLTQQLSAERRQALEQEYREIARRNHEAADEAMRGRMSEIIDAMVAARVNVAKSQGISISSAQVTQMRAAQEVLVWTLYSQAPTEALDVILRWLELGYDPVSEEFRNMADRNRADSSELRRETIDRLIGCQVEINRRLAGEADAAATSEQAVGHAGSDLTRRASGRSHETYLQPAFCDDAITVRQGVAFQAMSL